MAEQKSKQEVASKWLEITVDRFERSIVKKRIGVSDTLLKSFVTNIISGSGGDPKVLTISFPFYGRFVDMGVGKGHGIGAKRELGIRNRAELVKIKGRRAKKWYSPTITSEVKKLAEIFAEEFGIDAGALVEQALEKAEIKIEL